MIVKINVCIDEIQRKGKKFPWKKPKSCPRCHDSVIWGHGFVLCYLENIDNGVYLKRYRCPCCGAVIKYKPTGYFKNFYIPIRTIYESLKSKIRNGTYLSGLCKNRQYFWFKHLMQNIHAILGEPYKENIVESFLLLMRRGINPVSCPG